MNQFFSFKRFALLVLKHWSENKKRYVLSVLAFLGLLIAWFVFAMIIEEHHPVPKDVQAVTYFFPLFVAGTFYASQYFRDLGTRAKGINFLLVPASTFEKFLCSLLYTVILFFIIFTASFYLVDILMIAFANNFFETGKAVDDTTVVNVFKANVIQFSDGSAINFLLLFFTIQSAFLFGSAYFQKYGFIKTIIAGFVVCFTFFCLMSLLYGGEPLLDIPWIAKVSSFLVMYALTPLLWIMTYFQLKVKQV